MKRITLVLSIWILTTSAYGETASLAQKSGPPRLGLTYFAFLDGPGLSNGNQLVTPNVLGLPDDDGLRVTAFLSAKYRFTERWALDFQSRVQYLFNNAKDAPDFQPFRWQSPRIGVSGKLISGEDWALTGALNTDFPYFIPAPLGGGFVSERRTTILNPGMFAKFSYQPKASAWSVSSLVMPRAFFYANRDAAEPQLSRAGYSPGLKPEFTLSFSPSLNYAVSPKVGARLGTEITYRKLVLSSWNPFEGSLNGSDTQSKAWRLAAVPLQLGVTYEPNEAINLSIFVQGFPIAAQRVRQDGSAATFAETTSIGMWISGAIL